MIFTMKKEPGESSIDFYLRIRNEFVNGDKQLATNTIYEDKHIKKTIIARLEKSYPTYMQQYKPNGDTRISREDFIQAAWCYIVQEIPKYTGKDSHGNPVEFQTFLIRNIKHLMAEEIAKMNGRTRHSSTILMGINKTITELKKMGYEEDEITDSLIAEYYVGSGVKPTVDVILKHRKNAEENVTVAFPDDYSPPDFHTPEKSFFEKEEQSWAESILSNFDDVQRMVIEVWADSFIPEVKNDSYIDSEQKKCDNENIEDEDTPIYKSIAEKRKALIKELAENPNFIDALKRCGYSHLLNKEGKISELEINKLYAKARKIAEESPQLREKVAKHRSNKGNNYGELIDFSNEDFAINDELLLFEALD